MFWLGLEAKRAWIDCPVKSRYLGIVSCAFQVVRVISVNLNRGNVAVTALATTMTTTTSTATSEWIRRSDGGLRRVGVAESLSFISRREKAER